MRRMYRSREVRARWAPYTNFDASHRLEAPGLPKLREKSPKVSGRIRKYSVLRRLSSETGSITTAARGKRSRFGP